MRYAIYMPPNTKDLAINQTMVAYGARQNATAFARANNSDLLRSLKHLMETRLYVKFKMQKFTASQVEHLRISFYNVNQPQGGKYFCRVDSLD